MTGPASAAARPAVAAGDRARLVRIGDVAAVVRGVSYRPADIEMASSPDAIPILRATNIQDDRLVMSDLVYVIPDRVGAAQMLRRWDVVIAMSSGSKLAIGKLAQLTEEWTGSFGAFCAAIRPDPDSVDPSYLSFVLRTRRFRTRIEHMAQGTNIRNLSREHILGFQFPSPSMDEQRRIVERLLCIERATDAIRSTLKSSLRLRDSLLAHFFSEDDQPTIRLGEVAEVKGGKRMPKGRPFAERATPYPYIRVVDFNDGSVDETNLRYLLEADRRPIERYIIRARDVYISIAGTIGVVGVVPESLDGANLTENAARIVVRDPSRLLHRYLYWYLASPLGQSHIRLRTTKTSQPKLALMRIADIPMPVVDVSTQEDVIRGMDRLQAKIRSEHRSLAAVVQVFASAVQELIGRAM